MTLTTADALDTSAGITSVFFETFDAERYSVHYSDGDTADLKSETLPMDRMVIQLHSLD